MTFRHVISRQLESKIRLQRLQSRFVRILFRGMEVRWREFKESLKISRAAHCFLLKIATLTTIRSYRWLTFFILSLFDSNSYYRTSIICLVSVSINRTPTFDSEFANAHIELICSSSRAKFSVNSLLAFDRNETRAHFWNNWKLITSTC